MLTILRQTEAAVFSYPDEGARSEILDAGVTLTCAAWTFNPARTRTLLVRHPKFGWVPPGGHVEQGEHPRRGALRELREETGVTESYVIQRPASVSCAGSSDRRLGMLAYVVDVLEDSPLQPETEAAWFDLDDLPASIFPDDPARLRQAARELRPATDRFKLIAVDVDHASVSVVSEHHDLADGLLALRTRRRDEELVPEWSGPTLRFHLV